MTLAESIRQQGLQQGIEKGIKKTTKDIALRLLQEGTHPTFIKKVTGLSLEQIQSLEKI